MVCNDHTNGDFYRFFCRDNVTLCVFDVLAVANDVFNSCLYREHDMGVMFATNTLQVWHGAIATGVLGGLTTFSTMMTQSAQRPRRQSLYLIVQVATGLLSFVLGSLLAVILK